MSNVFDFGSTAYLAGGKAVVEVPDNRELTVDGKYPTVDITPKKEPNPGQPESVKFVQWGFGNRLPLDIISKVYKNVTTSANIEFNNRLGVGDGIMVYRKVRTGNKLTVQPLLDSEAPEVFDFLMKCNYGRVIQEQIADLSVFGDANAEILIGRDGKTVSLISHKELCYSRLSETNDNGEIEWHGYSAKWSEGTPDDVIVTRYLDRRQPYLDLLRRIGQEPDLNGDKADTKERRFIMSMSQPVPGRFYYNKPFWWSIFEAGWYDFACAIPEFKRALINNQMVVKWHVHIDIKFWDKLFKTKGAVSEKQKKATREEFLSQLDKFLAGAENAGKSFVSEFKYDNVKGQMLEDIRITPVDNGLKGGEYISDSEEVSNIICYAMGVHPSLIGANPGKNGTISGSEARELFTIKQTMLKPIRDTLVLPLYIAKRLNGWPDDIHFAIPNLMLTTLDKNTGTEKSIGNEKL